MSREHREEENRIVLQEGTTGDDMLQAAPPVTTPVQTRRTHVASSLGEPSLAAEVDTEESPSPGPPLKEDRRRGRDGWAARDLSEVTGKELVEGEMEVECGRERLKRHRVAMAGRVWIPETWGQEGLLKDWVDCAAIDRALLPSGLGSARQALREECRLVDPSGSGFRIESRCLST